MSGSQFVTASTNYENNLISDSYQIDKKTADLNSFELSQIQMRPFNLNDLDSSSPVSAEKKNKVLGKRAKNNRK